MTHKQLVAAKEKWQEAKGSAHEGAELHCIEMMHSILIYDYFPEEIKFTFPEDNYYLQDYIKELGIERVKELWAEQVEDFRHAKVGYAGTDPDGCQYNYCKWADD